MVEDKKKNASRGISLKVDMEFKELCDEYKKKISAVTWDAVDYSYAEITRILARKVKESKLI
jgi:hypothetical protein